MTRAIGDEITQRTHRGAHTYTLAMTKPFVTAAGAQTSLLTWAGNCSRCGATFLQTSGRNPPRYMIRTCEIHRGRK